MDECFHDIFYSNFLQMETCVVYVRFVLFSVVLLSTNSLHHYIFFVDCIAKRNDFEWSIYFSLSTQYSVEYIAAIRITRGILQWIHFKLYFQTFFFFKSLDDSIFHVLTKRPIWCAFWTTIFHAIGNYDWTKFEYSVNFFSFQFQHINFDAVAVASLTYD